MNKILFAITTLFLTGISFSQQEDPNMMRMYEVYTYIDRMYVDDVPNKEISEAAIISMLEKLDPHSTYIPAEEVEQANERINGSFVRSEEHTSELQSRPHLVCRLLLEKKKAQFRCEPLQI